ncbi:MAG: phenylalanine--tRNA ligase subunit beta [Gammaproteobacteria bacterium]|nr:phenylalanine--tRNA ligase subunit beta [Gammaproteobacteria bacterium]
MARVHGYDRIPERLPRVELSPASRTESHRPEARFRDLLIDRDYREAISYSFVDPELEELTHPGERRISLQNPIASNMSVMRSSLWTGLLSVMAANYRRQQRRIRLFETGHVFLERQGERLESSRIGGAASGALMRNARNGGRQIDFFDLKGDVESLLCATGCRELFSFEAAAHPALHPGQCARVLRAGQQVGLLGMLHPALQQRLDIDQAVFLFELEFTALVNSRLPEYRPVSRHPAISRDLSILVENTVAAAQLRDVIMSAGGSLLVDVELFDVYRGKGVPESGKSLSFTLTFQDSSRNLTDADIEEGMRRILKAVEKKLGGQLRT